MSKEEEILKKWHNLKIGERFFLEDSEYVASIMVVRVPGGWVVHNTFVPYNEEFEGKGNE